MFPSLARGCSFLSIGLILAGLTTSCSRTGAKDFRNVELTKEDIISLYEVRVDKRPARKFEWNFRSPHYVRWVVEQRDASNGEWKQFRTWAYGQPWDRAFLLVQTDKSGPDLQNGQEWNFFLSIRTGGSRTNFDVMKVSGSSLSNLSLPMLRGTLDTESHGDDPDKILIITAGQRSYRLRMEASEEPYAAN